MILHPSFSLDGYSYLDAKRKNDNGICAFKNCNNKSAEYCMEVYVCTECFDVIMEQKERELERFFIEQDHYLFNALEYGMKKDGDIQ